MDFCKGHLLARPSSQQSRRVQRARLNGLGKFLEQTEMNTTASNGLVESRISRSPDSRRQIRETPAKLHARQQIAPGCGEEGRAYDLQCYHHQHAPPR